MKHVLGLLVLAFLGAPLLAQAQASSDKKCVILLHGLLRDSGSMAVFKIPLERRGYVVVNESYASTRTGITELAEKAVSASIKKCPPSSEINFVTHSMGGILVRSYYANSERTRPNRVVMLAPPNKGSEVIDSEAFEVLGWISGESGSQLGTDENSIPNQLGPVDYPVGVIAGETTINPVFSVMIPGADDGAVAVDRTHVEGEADWILIPASHSFIMYSEVAQRHTFEFLENGKFER